MSHCTGRPPRVAAVHDISGFGRSALTVVMPAMSALGIQVCPAPTALLSTQTDGFTDFVFHDLTEELRATFEHWSSLEIEFDCIYTGFLGSHEQIGLMKAVFESYPKPAMRIVDPVMGDAGELYSTYTAPMRDNMRILAGMADIVTPNYTECCFLTDTAYREGLISEEEAVKRVKELAGLGAKTALVTGLHIREGFYTNMAYESDTGRLTAVDCPKLPGSYPGTGDLFTSVFGGLILLEYPLGEALRLTGQYLSETIALTNAIGAPRREGVALERTLPSLIRLAR